jgi:MFS family permease
MTAPDTTSPTLDQVDIPAPRGSVWDAQHRSLTIGMIMIITGAAFEALAVATILPKIVGDLGGLELYGWAFSAFVLVRLVSIALTGAEVDRRGPAVPFVGGVVVFVAGLLVAGFAPSMPILIAGRAVQGFGSGVISAVVYAIIARGYDESLKPRMLAMSATAWVVPGLVGPGLAGVLVEVIGWRWIFLGLVPIPLLALFLALPSLRHLNREGARTPQMERVFLALRQTIGAGLMMAALRFTLLPALGMLAVGAVLAIPALRKLLPPGALRAAAGLPAAVATMGLLSMSFFGVDAFIPLLLNEVRHQSAAFAGLALTAATMAWTAGSWLLDRYARRFSRRMFATVGLVLIVVGSALALLVVRPDVPPWLGILSWGIAGLGMGMTYTTLSLVTLELAPKGQEGVSSAALQLTDSLGVAIGTGVGGAFVAAYGAGNTHLAIETHYVLMIGVAMLALVTARGLATRGATAAASAEA